LWAYNVDPAIEPKANLRNLVQAKRCLHKVACRPPRNSPGTGRRFDSVWISRHWVVQCIEHLYEMGIAAGSDHAPVMVDLDLTTRPENEEETWFIFEAPGFRFGEIMSPPDCETEDGSEITTPYSVHGSEAP
jgi:hypothetical protein